MEKYYTPKIEDIRIGYECKLALNGASLESWNNDDIDENCVLSEPEISDIISWAGTPLNQFIATRYLTKEQIEAEGWKCDDPITPSTAAFVFYLDKSYKDEYSEYCGFYYKLFYNYVAKIITIEKLSVDDSGSPYYDLYEGNQNHILKYVYCPSINEFRYITKTLLKIV
jgi:hypothetical protein